MKPVDVLVVTGHRDDKLGFEGVEQQFEPYSFWLHERLALLGGKVLERYQPKHVVTGMALGWDQALPHACWDLGIPFTAAVPFEGQEARWPQQRQQEYRAMLEMASHVHVVCPDVVPGKSTYQDVARALHARNDWMLKQAKEASNPLVVALWNGDSKGGTAGAVKKAKKLGLPVVNVWQSWVKHRDPHAKKPTRQEVASPQAALF